MISPPESESVPRKTRQRPSLEHNRRALDRIQAAIETYDPGFEIDIRTAAGLLGCARRTLDRKLSEWRHGATDAAPVPFPGVNGRPVFTLEALFRFKQAQLERQYDVPCGTGAGRKKRLPICPTCDQTIPAKQLAKLQNHEGG